jgi:transcriptional regulator with XRE-family HTH domain
MVNTFWSILWVKSLFYDSNHNLLGEQILRARKNLNLSQRELAKLAGKSQSWIRDIEKGRLKVKLEDQVVLRKVLGLNTAWF